MYKSLFLEFYLAMVCGMAFKIYIVTTVKLWKMEISKLWVMTRFLCSSVMYGSFGEWWCCIYKGGGAHARSRR
jgi:hypothetical protein